MSNEQKQNQPQKSAQQPSGSPTQAKEKTEAEKDMAKKDKVQKVIFAWLKQFFGGEKEITKAISSGELWDLRQSARGLTAEVFNLDSRTVVVMPIMVSSTNTQHLSPDKAKVALDGWNEVVESGALRQ